MDNKQSVQPVDLTGAPRLKPWVGLLQLFCVEYAKYVKISRQAANLLILTLRRTMTITLTSSNCRRNKAIIIPKFAIRARNVNSWLSG